MDTAQVSPGKPDPVSLYSDRESPLHINKYLAGLLVFLLLIIAFGGGFYFYKTRQFPWKGIEVGPQGIKVTEILVKGGEYIISERIDAYSSPNEETPIAYIIPGKYFQVLEQKGGWIQIKMTRIESGQAASGWIKFSKTAYQLVGNK